MIHQDNSKGKTFHFTTFFLEDGEKTSETDTAIEVLDAFPFYVLLVDSDHNIQFANKAALSDLGLDPQKIVGKYCPLVVHGQSYPFPGCPVEEALHLGQSVERELFDEKTARWFNSSAYFTKLRTQDGKVVFLHFIRDITQTKRTLDELERNYQKQEVLNKLLRISLMNSTLEEQVDQALDLITSIQWLSLQSKGGIFLVEEDSEMLVMKANRGLEKLLTACARVPFGRCLCGRAAKTGEIEYASCIDERHEVLYDGISPHGHYCVPIKSSGVLLGVINLYIKENSPRDERTEEFLTAIADVLAGIIDRKRTRQELEYSLDKVRSALGATIQAMSMVVETRDPYTAGHQQHVANLARAIATEMGLPDEQIEGIRMAGAIHDIGKIAVPSEILSKPGKINDIEFSLIKTHSQVGYEILKNIEFPWPVAKIVLQHHERLNGTGYPNGLSGKDILIEARVIAVADVVEAMATHRPYRAALSIEKALYEISTNSGILYDPNVVAACLRLFNEKGFILNQDQKDYKKST